MQSIWRNSSNQGTCIKAYKTDAGTEKFMNSVLSRRGPTRALLRTRQIKKGPNKGTAPDTTALIKIESEEKPGTCLLRAELFTLQVASHTNIS